jgi:hypothetical protein
MSMLKRGLFSAPPIPSTLNFDTYPDDSLSYVLRREEMFGKLSKSDGFKLNEDLKGILKTEAYLLDVIRASNGKRPIHFASTFNLKDLFGLEKYLKQDYLVFTLTRRYNNDYAASYVTIDTKAAYDNFLKAEFIDWRTQPFIDDITPRICVSYVYGGCRLASALYNEGKKKECTLVLDRLVSSFPDTIQPFNVNLFQAPALYAKCGQVDKGLAIAEVLIKNGKERYSRSVNNTTVAYSEWDTEMRSALYVIQEVLPFYKEYAADKPELTEAHQQAFNEMVEVYQRKLKDKNIKND